MAPVPLRPLGFGEILDGAFALYRNHFLTLFLTALLPFLPLSLALGFLMVELAALEEGGDVGAVLLMMPLGLIYGVGFLIVWGAITRQTAQALTGGEVSLADGFRVGLRRVLPLLGAGLITYFGVMAIVMVVGMVLAIVLGIAAMALGAGAAVVAGLGAVVVIVLVMLGFARFFAIAPAVVIEGHGPIGALTRSWHLARGAVWRVLGLILVAWLITALPMIGVMMFTGFGAAFTAPEEVTFTPAQMFVQQVASGAVGALTMPFWIGAITLLYYDRRVRAEAFDLELEAAAPPPA